MDVLKKRYVYLGVSAVFFIISIFLLLVPKLNLGIDMTGGIQMEYDYQNNVNMDEIKNKLEEEKESFLDNGNKVINNVSVYSIT